MGTDRLLLPTVGPPIKRRAGLRRKQAGRVEDTYLLSSNTLPLFTSFYWVLTWEDGYYDNSEQHEPPEGKFFRKTLETFYDGHYSHDPLGLAVAKMSYHVYSLGEGIVGQVAVTGKHQWITADEQIPNFSSTIEYCDGWQTQFSAGIKTIVVVAVVPHGVLQLGSLDKVTEDVNLVTRIRNAFLTLQESSAGEIKPLHSCKSSGYVKGEDASVSKNVGIELSGSGGFESLKTKPDAINVESFKSQVRLLDDRICGGEPSGCKDTAVGLKQKINVQSQDSAMDMLNICGNLLPAEKIMTNGAYFPMNPHPSSVYDGVNHNGMFTRTNHTEMYLQNDMEASKTIDMYPSNASLKFPAGYELHEVLGPAFLKDALYLDWQTEYVLGGKAFELSEGMSGSQLTSDSPTERLLEAVVADVCHSSSDVKSDTSLCKSGQSLLTTERIPEPSTNATTSACSEGYSMGQSQTSFIGEDMQNSLSSSGVCGVMSPKGFSSTYSGTGSEHLDKSLEPAKNSKRRARPGESSRPRPRDRQLIQDRIKELRELVPNGAKCSIDSLLERTIKHMLFLQGITKHADKLTKCSNMKLHQKENGMLGTSNTDQGSSWAVEVGGQLKVCSIIVENLNKNGQILVEMLCEECSHFLEIAEAIRSLGLTILKGITEAHGEKTWICFVVEGENNRNIHRMDILWSLVQILQRSSTM
ncbi:transcription factor EMB1444 [Cucumis melo var. makuwa]|uniref:Transcription factor EMB1444 n=1 Tax=Cucumis melo var. makuwa TaxID=1194695 RepID=A0A5A7V1K9_CUCMM|nr:transcription factor EMB1444 [Cucumis melo var. makuwa]TYK26108.1 transcription factor EMB1444 [Cucumis melo var. makuwa]